MWVVGGFPEGNPKHPICSFIAKGNGDIEELKQCLVDDRPMYALYRTVDVIDGYTTTKFVYIYWYEFYSLIENNRFIFIPYRWVGNITI